MEHVIGIDLGGTRIKGAVFDPDTGDLLSQHLVSTRDGERERDEPAFLQQVRTLIARLETEAGLGKPEAPIGISSPGMTNREASMVDFMPGRLEGLEGLNWSDALERRCRVLNDAHAALLGEIWKGSARGLKDVVFLTLGTGVGGAVVSAGRLLRGHLGRAGHLGHLSLDYHGPGDICGTPGSLEDLVGDHSVRVRTGGRFQSTRALVEAVVEGDAEAEAAWEDAMRALSAGIASLVNVLDPEAVLIGGGISEAWEVISPRLERWLEEFEWRPGGFRVEVRKATLGEWAGTYGAASFLLDAEIR